MNARISSPCKHRPIGLMLEWFSCRLIAGHIIMICLFVCFMACAPSAHAAITPTGDLDPIYTGDDPWVLGDTSLFVGQSGTATLMIDSGSDVSNGYSYLASETGSSATVTIKDPGSTWETIDDLHVGRRGDGTLNIQNGAVVTSTDTYLGRYENAMGTVTVTGADSTLNSTGILYVGQSGIGQLHIDNGGVVNCGVGYLGYAGTAASSIVTVSDAGSALHVSEELYVGRGANASLEVSNGGTVSSTDGYVGYDRMGYVTVDGPDSSWSTVNSLVVGSSGGTVTVSNGGLISSGNGFVSGSSTGGVTITGAGSAWDISQHLVIGYRDYGTLNILADAAVNCTSDTFITQHDDGAGTLHLDQGTLNTGGLLASFTDIQGTGVINTSSLVSDIDLVFDDASDLDQQFTLNSLPGQNVTINMNLTNASSLGSLGAGYKEIGSLVLSNGMQITSASGYLGYLSQAQGTASVTSDGTAWHIDGDLHVGYWGSGELNITDGGTVNSTDSYIAYRADSVGNVTISGPLSRWNTTNTLTIGQHGEGTMNIEQGSQVQSNITIIGDYSGHGILTVSDQGSQLTTLGTLYVSQGGEGILNVQNAGKVYSATGIIGDDTYDNGIANISGQGSAWENTGDLYVGTEGNAELNIYDNGLVQNDTGYIGYDSTGTVSVNGPGTTWNNRSNLHIGYYGSGELTIENGAVVNSASSSIGFYHSYNPYIGTGVVTITGDGSAWNNTGRINIAISGTGTVNVLDGGSLYNTFGLLAYGSASNATVNISGQGSSWINSHGLTIGQAGTGSLTIENGAAVSNTYAYIGNQSGSIGDVTVTGNGSTWTCSSDLHVGYYGKGTLSISSGAEVQNNIGYIGYYGSIGAVNVAGVNTTWNNNDTLHVGYGATGTLTISDHAVVNVGNHLTIAEYDFANGTVNLDGGVLDLHGTNITGGAGAATFNFTDGLIKNAAQIDLKQTFVQSGGTLAPGGSIGQTSILGGYTLSAGTLEIELGGLGNPHDLLTVIGNIDIADLGTFLDLQAIGTMQAGTYTIIETTNGTITGTFASVTGLGLEPGIVDVQYTSNAVTITLNQDVVPEPATLMLLALGIAGGISRR